MIGYLYEVVTSDGNSDEFSFEIYATPTTRISWSSWCKTSHEALTAPQESASARGSHQDRLMGFNIPGRPDKLKLVLHSTYTPSTHPEYFI